MLLSCGARRTARKPERLLDAACGTVSASCGGSNAFHPKRTRGEMPAFSPRAASFRRTPLPDRCTLIPERCFSVKPLPELTLIIFLFIAKIKRFLFVLLCFFNFCVYFFVRHGTLSLPLRFRKKDRLRLYRKRSVLYRIGEGFCGGVLRRGGTGLTSSASPSARRRSCRRQGRQTRRS